MAYFTKLSNDVTSKILCSPTTDFKLISLEKRQSKNPIEYLGCCYDGPPPHTKLCPYDQGEANMTCYMIEDT
jgi:hypothetical protein